MMKTLFYTAALTLMASLAFISCARLQDKQDDQGIMQVKRQATITYQICCTQDMLDAIDMVVTYMDKGGTKVTETISDTIWTKTVVNDLIPVKIGLDWSLSPKTADKITKETFDEIRAFYSIKCEETGDNIDGGQILVWVNFPASRLGEMCDFENFQHTYARDTESFHYPCFMVKPMEDGNDLKYDLAKWNDDENDSIK